MGSGAFAVFEGGSVQSRYRFDERRRFNQNLRLGRLQLLGVELLKPGDVVPILSGGHSVHSLFHLVHPSISIVVRTVQDDESLPQLDFCGGGIGFKSDMGQGDAKALTALRLLARRDRAANWRFICEQVRAMSSDQRFWFLRAFSQEIPSLSDEHLGLLRASMREEWELFVPELQEDTLLNASVGLRNVVRDTDARLLLALALNVPVREVFESLARDHLGARLANAWEALMIESGASMSRERIAELSTALAQEQTCEEALRAASTEESVLRPLWQLIYRRHFSPSRTRGLE